MPEAAKTPEELIAELLYARKVDSKDRRRFIRHELRVPVEFVPLLNSGPNEDNRLQAETRNISSDGVSLVIDEAPLSPRWAVRLDLRGRAAMLEVDVRHIRRTSDGRFLLSCRFIRRLDSRA